ncbi:AMP-binding protein [Taibaiella koreensis]|uniref:AMP-binding protein n=1 Tax=Taibaiella koreensis TaxID=1268548 RepID=UPI000E59DC2A|nr:AMP-binding protein [Taibaiella koreensis]
MSTKIYDFIRANTSLRFIDPLTSRTFAISDFDESFNAPEGRGLAFLYLDNSVRAVEALLHFLCSDWALCLLNPKLEEAEKQALEKAYLPGYIYDPVRGRKGLTGASPYPIASQIKLLLSTSGSTGSPKMVKLSEENIISNALSILDYLPVKHTDTVPLNLPLFYSYGFSVFTTNAIAGGRILCTCRDLIQKEFWEDWQQYQCTSLAGVPYVYEMIQRFGLLPRMLPSLRYLTQAGGKLNPTLVTQFAAYSKEHGFPFYVMYGQTEATARMSWLEPTALERKAGAIGKAIKDGSFTIDPENCELLYSGPNVFGGYAEHAGDLARYEQPDVLRTGDIAMQDAEGDFYLQGRIKRFVKLFGLRINLDETESLLRLQFPHNRWLCAGDKDQFLYALYEGAPVAEADVRLWISSRLKVHPQAIKVQRLEAIPLNSNGKADYTKAMSLLAS